MGYIKKIKNNPTMEGMVEIIPDVIFSKKTDLKMQIITPWWDRMSNEIPRYPLIVFVQGSAWTFPNVWYEVPQLCDIAKKGYVVATVTHRNSMEGNPFPACLEDVKTAIRFLRKKSDDFAIDAERVGIFGTSSGGNLALLTALTQGESEYITEEYDEYSDEVNFCVSCFPPANLTESMVDETFDSGIKDIFVALSGGSIDENMTVLKKMSPYHIFSEMIEKGIKKNLPPFFLAHGDADGLIPYKQSADLYEKMMEYGADVSFVTVEDAPHEGSFWGSEIWGLITEFIEKNI